jgi:serine/threonine protein kinase
MCPKGRESGWDVLSDGRFFIVVAQSLMTEQSRYFLAKKINRGGMAEIYLGKVVGEDGFQRLCAIKRILPHFAQDQEFIQMFRDEAHICKRLQHANIVKVEGFEEVEGSYAIIMEYVDGADLRSLLHTVEQSKQKMSVPFSCYIIAEAARGLHYAHTKEDEITQLPLGIVHRDISPQNILVSYDGEVKVTDFGIADAENKITETRPGIVKGKYSYMSPEQISAKDVDARSDVFALGIVLWEMLAMKRLFQGESEVDTIQRVKNCVITQDLRQLNPEVDQELDEIIKKALAKDHKKRYRSAADFEKDLRRYMSRKFPDFTSEELGNFLKKLMEVKRNESAIDIKKTLTETNLKPGKRKQSSAVAPQSTSMQVPVLDEPPQATNFSIAKSAKYSQSMQSNQTPINGNRGKPKGVFGGTKTHNNIRKNLAKLNRGKSPGIVLVIGILILGFLVFKIVDSQFGGVKPAQLTIRTQPSRVKIMVNQTYVNQGKYVRATSQYPLRINLKPGKHSITISRAGYHSFNWELDLEGGDKIIKDDIILREKSALAALKIRSKGEGALLLNIEDGYFVAQLSPPKISIVAPDVMIGRSYQMKVTTAKKESFTCKFAAKAQQWRQPNELTIDAENRRCLMTGP